MGEDFLFRISEYGRRSEKVNCHFLNYRLSFRKLQIFISQTTDSHFANCRFSLRKLQILISQTTDFHFVSFRFVSLHFVSQTTVSHKLCDFFRGNLHCFTRFQRRKTTLMLFNREFECKGIIKHLF